MKRRREYRGGDYWFGSDTAPPRQLCWPTDGVGLQYDQVMPDAGSKAPFGGDDRHDPIPRQPFHEQVSQAWSHRPTMDTSRFAVERGPTREGAAKRGLDSRAQGIKSSTALTGRELALPSARKSESSTCVIDFPNHSRSYDSTRRAVRFWGHDSAIEASFFISEDALRRLQPDARSDESGFLNAFDSNRDLICVAAAKLYVRGSRGSYDLVAANF